MKFNHKVYVTEESLKTFFNDASPDKGFVSFERLDVESKARLASMDAGTLFAAGIMYAVFYDLADPHRSALFEGRGPTLN